MYLCRSVTPVHAGCSRSALAGSAAMRQYCRAQHRAWQVTQQSGSGSSNKHPCRVKPCVACSLTPCRTAFVSASQLTHNQAAADGLVSAPHLVSDGPQHSQKVRQHLEWQPPLGPEHPAGLRSQHSTARKPWSPQRTQRRAGTHASPSPLQHLLCAGFRVHMPPPPRGCARNATPSSCVMQAGAQAPSELTCAMVMTGATSSGRVRLSTAARSSGPAVVAASGCLTLSALAMAACRPALLW